MEEARTNLFGLDRGEIEAALVPLGEPAYRARQVYSWLRIDDWVAERNLAASAPQNAQARPDGAVPRRFAGP